MVVNNPNNWHWVNKNCLKWSQTYFADKSQTVKFDSDDLKIEITSTTVTGDCDVSNRKGKVVCIFDMQLVFNVKGSYKGVDFEGSITVPEFMHDETEFQFEYKTLGDNLSNVKQHFIPLLQDQILLTFQKDLIESHTKDLQE